jgi:peptidoglycan hydrolase CwlO-like protein
MAQPPNRPDGTGEANDALAAEVASAKAENSALKELIKSLQAQIAELERRLGPQQQ